MKFLLDTNAIIPAEPTSPDNVEPGTRTATQLLGLVAEGQHQAYVHPASLRELLGDRQRARRELRAELVTKYPQLPSPPKESDLIKNEIGEATPGSNDETDHLLLAAVLADAVDYLVTNDGDIHTKAKRLGIGNRVLTLEDAVSTVRGLFDSIPRPPPSVDFIVCHELDENDPIFETFRIDYPGFDGWLRKCKLEHRKAWIVTAPDGRYAGVCIIKEEEAGKFALLPPVLKICSFKISDQFRGFRFGELMLKAVFEYAAENEFSTVFVMAFPHHEQLLILFRLFGFEQLDVKTNRDELVLAKRMVCSDDEYSDLSPLEFHVRFGPPLLKVEDGNVFVVPIQPKYHALLFPELEMQASLWSPQPFGNSIMKAYLCHAKTRQLQPGSTILFYQSESAQSAATVGVIEETLISTSAVDVARFVGQRTVYSFTEIESMCYNEVLVILFRQARNLDPALTLATLQEHRVVNGPPQSIVRVSEGGTSWLIEQIEPPH